MVQNFVQLILVGVVWSDLILGLMKGWVRMKVVSKGMA